MISTYFKRVIEKRLDSKTRLLQLILLVFSLDIVSLDTPSSVSCTKRMRRREDPDSCICRIILHFGLLLFMQPQTSLCLLKGMSVNLQWTAVITVCSFMIELPQMTFTPEDHLPWKLLEQVQGSTPPTILGLMIFLMMLACSLHSNCSSHVVRVHRRTDPLAGVIFESTFEFLTGSQCPEEDKRQQKQHDSMLINHLDINM